jgi:hypothetical protein
MGAAPKPAYYRMTLSEFRKHGFVGRAPCVNTIKAAIERKDWLGEVVGGLWFIFVDADGQPIPGRPKTPGTGNPEADALIMDWELSR